MAKVKKLYIGKNCKQYKNGEVIEVELIDVKDDSGKVVDTKLPASLVGRVRDAIEGADSESDSLSKENSELKKEVAELKKQLSAKK